METNFNETMLHGRDFGLRSGTHGDCTGLTTRALGMLDDGGTLQLEPGDYHFWPEAAERRFYNLSNNRAGEKAVALLLHGRRNVTIDGNGAKLIFHGEILPFVLDACDTVTLRNFSIDWERPFLSQGEVVRAESSCVDIFIDTKKYPCEVRDGRLIFLGEGWEQGFTEGIFEVEAPHGRPAPGSGDNLGGKLQIEEGARDCGNSVFRLFGSFGKVAKPGNFLLLRHTHRHFPGVFAQHCRNVTLEGVNLHHAAGTAILAQFCENVALKKCNVKPAPESGRYFCALADASHFVNCKGRVVLSGCDFANQLDDATNIHGIHYRVDRVIGPKTLCIARGHFEQRGVPCGFSGDRVYFRNQETLLPVCSNIIAAVTPLDDWQLHVEFEEKLLLPAGVPVVMENLAWTPEILIENCRTRYNRARGILVSSPRKTCIKGNVLEPSGAAIKISGDADYWFESGAVSDVCIEGNTFGNCCYGPRPWGRTAIDIDPEIKDPWSAEACYHRNIKVTGNTFRSSHAGLLYARSVEGITFSDNRIEGGHSVERTHQMESRLTFDACRDIRVAGNRVSEDAPSANLEEINDSPTGRHYVVPQPHLGESEEKDEG